jgi:hypothetical protein
MTVDGKWREASRMLERRLSAADLWQKARRNTKDLWRKKKKRRKKPTGTKTTKREEEGHLYLSTHSDHKTIHTVLSKNK